MVERRQTELFCDWLDGFLDYERVRNKTGFSLETMRFLAERFRHPERFCRSVHVAGSKGKGSTSAMIASILQAAGNNTGLYTSPHMIDFTERVRTPSGPFSEEVYGRACDCVVPLVDSIIPGSIPGDADPTWFELVTLFAFVTFREARCDWSVIETGLGGRLDATNVVMPEACVLTPIELEHTEYLGDTIEKIAREKAGIIKEGVPVFVSAQPPAARKVFEDAAKRLGCPFFSMEDAVANLSAAVSPDGLETEIAFNTLPGGAAFARPLRVRLSLVNEIQAQNAALAAYTAKYLFPGMSEDTIERGLAEAWLPGRFEIVSREPPVVFDGAHTLRSLALTVGTFKKLYPGNAHLIFACAADKDVDSMAALFSNGFSDITITRPGNRKQSDIDHAAKAFFGNYSSRADITLNVETDFDTAISRGLSAARDAGVPLLVTGSFYLVAEAKRILEARSPGPES